jgi:hypothetical protein
LKAHWTLTPIAFTSPTRASCCTICSLFTSLGETPTRISSRYQNLHYHPAIEV